MQAGVCMILKPPVIFCARYQQKNNFTIKNIFAKACGANAVKSKWQINAGSAFGKYLLITNTLSAGILMAVGDLIQQQLEYVNHNKHKDSYDWIRNKNMSIVGLCGGPCIHYFYKALDKIYPGVTMRIVAKKVFLDQTIASPFCIIVFFFGMGYLNGEPFSSALAEFKEKFLTVYMADCMVWIPSQFLNFYCLPPPYRVLYINLVTMCYNVFLSYMKHQDNPS